MSTRAAALAGRWYPGSDERCRREVEALLGSAPELRGVAGIVPHAGWTFSGSVAAQTLQALASAEPRPELLLIFGTHMGAKSPAHISRASGFTTPLGELLAAEELAAELADELDLREDPADSRWGNDDNTIEVQLPLIKYLLPDVQLAVIGPPASTEAIEIGRVATKKAQALDLPLAVIGSTDLTHYGPNYGFAPHGSGEDALRWVKEENDSRLIERVLDLDAEGVIAEAQTNRNACVPGAVAAAIAGAKELGATNATLLKYLTSYDVHPGSSFVGYASVVMH